MAEPSGELPITEALRFVVDIAFAGTHPSLSDDESRSVLETADSIRDAVERAEAYTTLHQLAIDIPEKALLSIDRLATRWGSDLIQPFRTPGNGPDRVFYNRPIGLTGLYLQVCEAKPAEEVRLYQPHSGRIIGSHHLAGTRINPGIQSQGRATNLKAVNP